MLTHHKARKKPKKKSKRIMVHGDRRPPCSRAMQRESPVLEPCRAKSSAIAQCVALTSSLVLSLALGVQDAETLKAVNGQVGTLVMDLEGQVLSSAGQLQGDVGEQAAEAVFSILQDSNSVLDGSKSEVLERVIINFPSFDYAVTLSGEEIYVVKRSKAALE